MAVPFVKIRYTPPSGTAQDVTDYVLCNSKRGVDLKAGVATIKLSNSPWRDKTGGVSIFQADGLLEVYADYAEITYASTQLILSGQIRELKPSIGEGGSTLEIVAADRTVLMLAGYWAKDFSSGTTVDNIIKQIVDFSSNRTVTTNNVASSGTVSAFPTVSPRSFGMKPVVDIIQELSGPAYTGDDRTYMFYVDKNNDLHWFYPAQSSSGTIVEGTTEYYSWQMDKNADAVVNMVIYNCGTDLNGNGNLWYYWDSTSNSNNLRMKYYPLLQVTDGTGAIGSGMFDQEIAAGNLVESSTGTVPYKGKLYTAASSGTTSWGVAFASLADYKSAWRAEQRVRADKIAKTITARLGKLAWHGSLELKGTNSYTAGDLLTFTSQTIGLSEQLLRVVDVQHHIDTNGWVTTLELKEDEQAVA
jgi:hypothetical protein